jgi:hypothetical protein
MIGVGAMPPRSRANGCALLDGEVPGADRSPELPLLPSSLPARIRQEQAAPVGATGAFPLPVPSSAQLRDFGLQLERLALPLLEIAHFLGEHGGHFDLLVSRGPFLERIDGVFLALARSHERLKELGGRMREAGLPAPDLSRRG